MACTPLNQCCRSWSGFNGVPGSGSGLSIRCRIQEGTKTHKKRKKLIIYIFWSAVCSLLRAEDFSCSLYVLYGGLGISKLQFFNQKRYIFLAVFFNFWSSKPWIQIHLKCWIQIHIQIRIQHKLLKPNFPLLPQMSRRGGGGVFFFKKSFIFGGFFN